MMRARHAALHCVIAAFAVGVAILLRWLLDPWLGAAQPFVMLYGAVAVVVWFSGYGAASFAAFAGYLLGNYFFIAPRGSFGLHGAADVVGLLGYAVSCALIIGLGEAMRKARQKAADAGRESLAHQQQLVTLLESISDGFYSVDRQWRFVYINAHAERYFGRARQEMLGKSIWEMYPEAVDSPLYKQLEQALAQRAPTQFEVILPRSQRWYEVRAYPSSNGLSVYFNDVQGRKEAEAALVLAKTEAERRARDLEAARTQSSEVQSKIVAAQHLLQVVADTVPALISYVDRDFRYRLNNRAYETWFERPRAEYQGRHVAEMLGDAAWQSVRPHAELALQGTASTFESRLPGKDGRSRWIRASFTPDVDDTGAVSGYVAHVTDITESKRIESALQKRNERLALLWEAAAVLLSADEPRVMLKRLFDRIAPHLGLDAYFNFMVSEGEEFLHLDSWAGAPDDIVASIRRLTFGESVCGTVAQQRTALLMSDVQHSTDPRFAFVKRLGMRTYVCNPLIAGDRLLGTLSFGSRTRDAFEPDELDFLRTISHYITLAYERLRLMKELREADRRKDEFLSVLAHELRNPLAPVRNGLKLIALAHGDPRLVREAAEMMERQVRLMVRLIDDLLDVSRITRGMIELRPERIELSAVVRQAVETARPNIDLMGHQVAIGLPEEPVYLDADPVRIAQVISNLLNNACKFTERGGHIAVTAERRDTKAVITVKDDGVGIPREKLHSIFDMFVQADSSVERRHSGLGLGLTLVKSLVELHGGTVSADSAGVGKGSELTITLPLAAEQRPPVMIRDTPSRSALGRRVLVVDDSVDSTDTLAMLLQIMGHEVRTAQNGAQALSIAAQFRPQLVLCDIGMPVMSGFEIGRKLREMLGTAVTLAALTGYGSEQDRERTRAAGFDLHLIKPVDMEVLQRVLASCSERTVQSA
jgi:PAS domain S-box-containing protein